MFGSADTSSTAITDGQRRLSAPESPDARFRSTEASSTTVSDGDRRSISPESTDSALASDSLPNSRAAGLAGSRNSSTSNPPLSSESLTAEIGEEDTIFEANR